MANTWGTNSWGVNSYGAQDDVTLTVTGISATSSIGSTTQAAGASGSPSGSQLTFTNAGAVGGTSVLFSVTGVQATLSMGEEDIARGIQQDVTGSQLTSTSGSVTIDDQFLIGAGWGRDTWGNLGWGVNYTVIPAEGVGIQLNASIGDETGITDVDVSVTGSQLNITYANPSFSIQIDSAITVLASEDQLDGLVGNLTINGNANIDITSAGLLTVTPGQAVGGTKIPVDVTGIEASITLGNIALEQSTNEPVTGQQLNLSLGQAAEIPGQIIGVSGIELTSSIGSVTVVGTSVVQPTGISATFSVGQVNVTAWQEINLGVNNVWTEVDLAA